MRADLSLSSDWVRESVENCSECHRMPDGIWNVCGWHENVTAAAKVVDDLLDGDQ